MGAIDTLLRIAGLLLVAAVALGGVLILLRQSGERKAPEAMAIGYPPERFPDLGLARSPALVELAAVQGRLLAIYRALPHQSGTAIWMLTFLRELRAIMDTAYAAAAVARLYGDEGPLTELSAEVARIESEVAGQITRRMLERGADDGADDLLAARMAALRLCASKLAYHD